MPPLYSFEAQRRGPRGYGGMSCAACGARSTAGTAGTCSAPWRSAAARPSRLRRRGERVRVAELAAQRRVVRRQPEQAASSPTAPGTGDDPERLGGLEAEARVVVRVPEQRDQRVVRRGRRGQHRAHQRRAGARALVVGHDADRPEGEHRGVAHRRAADRHVADRHAVALGHERQLRDQVAVRAQRVEQRRLDPGRREGGGVDGVDRGVLVVALQPDRDPVIAAPARRARRSPARCRGSAPSRTRAPAPPRR